MIIEKNRVVTFVYELLIQSGESKPIQQVEKSKPMKIIIGRGAILEPFENRLYGLEKGQHFDFTLESTETFGPYNEKAIAKFDKKIFIEDGKMEASDIVPGNYVPMETEEGVPFNGKIIDIAEKIVTIDFNHPLAGKDLHFKGEILEVREATPEEISSGTLSKVKNR